jgi:integrase
VASLQDRNGTFRFIFRFRGKQHFVLIGKVSPEEARAKAAHVDYLLLRLKQRLIDLPPGVDIVAFLQFDGRPPEGDVAKTVARALTLGKLRDRSLAARSEGREASTIRTGRIHFKHLVATLGESLLLSELTQSDLQRHIARRAKLGISATTIRKEVTTLRTAWHWAMDAGELTGEYPNKGLIYPKEDELPPYQTREEIERHLAAGSPTSAEVDALWEALYLRPPEIAELLGHVREHARHAWIYPLFCMAAHTGARRSELLAMRVADVDFEGGGVTIREKKRLKGKRSTRRAPLTPLLAEALSEWLKVHPGGPTLFCHAVEVERSKKRSRTTGHASGEARPTSLMGRGATVERRGVVAPSPLTTDESQSHFRTTVKGSKWEVLKGLHTLRHSMISCLAAAGIDQRIIDDIVGHTSPEMQRRYRHLTPALKTQAVASVFG